MPSIKPYFELGIQPYMNQRLYVGNGVLLPSTGSIGFPVNSDIVFTWLEDGTVTWPILKIWMHGVWGGVTLPAHIPLAAAHDGPTIVPDITVAAKENLTIANADPNVNPLGTIAQVSSPEIRYWINVSDISQTSTITATTHRWIPLIPKVSSGTINVYSGGTYPNVPPGGISATIYRITLKPYEIDYVSDYFGYYSEIDQDRFSLSKLEPSQYYSLCWEENGLHSLLYDAMFHIEPAGFREYDEIPDRTELNSRVAGEKALYEDEFLTAGQIEGSENVTLRWRNLDGSLTGYTTDPTKGGNLVIEATGGGGNSAVEGRTYGPFHTNPAAIIYYDETTATIRFQNEPLWYTDAMVSIADTKLPIEFDIVGDPVANPTTSIIRARAVNNNLHCSVTPLSGINYYPMALANAPVLDDYTVNHIRFVDTQNVTWDVKGDVMPTLMPDDSTAVRQGIIVKPVLNGLYVNWSIRSGNHSYFTQRSNPQQVISNDPNQPLPDAQMSSFTVDSLDGVDFWGKNGVVCTLIGAESNRLQLIVDRKLTIENTSGQTPPNDTTYIRFDNSIGNGTLNTGGGILGSLGISDPDVSINYIGFNDIGPFTQRVPALQVTFSVHDGLDTQGFNFNNAGAKTVRGFYPRQVGRFASQWSKDFDVLDTYRTVSNTQPILEVGFWGWDDGEHNIIASNAMYDSFPDSVYVQRVPPNLIGNPDGLALSINFEEGLYYIDATVQGIMGMKQTTPPNQPFNPIISQALHLHLYARPQSNGNNFPDVLTNKVLQSLDVMKNYTVVPYIANQPGQDTHTWYRQANASRPWSMQGGGLFWLRGLEHISTLLTLNAGGYNNDFYYQVCYAKMSCIKVANVADIHTYPKKIDTDTDPTMYNYAPQRWHDMIFY